MKRYGYTSTAGSSASEFFKYICSLGCSLWQYESKVWTQKWMGASLWLCGASNLKVISVGQAIFENLCIFWEKSSIICTTMQYFFCHSFTLNLSAKHMIFHLVLQDCLFGRDCQSFLSSKDVRRFCILSNFVVNNSNIYFPVLLAASQIQCRTFSPSQYIMSWSCKY